MTEESANLMDAASYPLPPNSSEEMPIPPLQLLATSVASLSATVEGQQRQISKLGNAMDEVIRHLSSASVASTPSPPVPPALAQAQPAPDPAQPAPAPAQPSPAEVQPALPGYLALPGHPASAVKLPEAYGGEPNGCEGFLLQCNLYLAHHPQMPDQSKVAAVITRLKGKALDWATAVWREGGDVTTSYARFIALFRAVFEHPIDGKERSERLLKLSQGTGTAAEYALQFRTLAAASGWNDKALIALYRRGLREDVRMELACRDQELTLDALINLSINLDYLLQERRRGKRASPLPLSLPTYQQDPDPEPMQVGSARLTPQERRRRIDLGLCLYCGDPTHQVELCPKRPQPGVRRPQPANPHKVKLPPPSLSSKPFLVPVTVRFGERCFSFSALLDSGAAGNFVTPTVAEALQLPLNTLSPPVSIQALDGGPVGNGTISQITSMVQLTVYSVHHESINFLVLPSMQHPVVLGLPWLQTHDPVVSWKGGNIHSWSPFCQNHCLKYPCASTSIESPDSAVIPEIPNQYMDLDAVFSKTRATHLPPHRPWDCAINLLPGTSPPRSRVYPLSPTETQAMEEYVQEALQQGFIRPSTSPAASGFFFVEKKDGGLRPCIDYRGLNAITVKYRYPLPLVPSAIEQLRGACYYTKLDLRSAYNLVRIREGDEWKTAFSTSTGHYEYLVMSYGLVNAPSVFQSFVNDILRDMIGKYVVAYIDDILIYSTTLAQHYLHVRQVLARLLHHQLYVKLEKCLFHQTTISFLGYVIGPDGARMEDQKVEAVTQWPAPKNIKELQRFLGFANFYRRFIRSFSSVAAPLTALLKGKPRSLQWTDAAQDAFTALKQRFTTAPILKFPDPTKQFVVEVDASDVGVGAVLSQRRGEPPKLHPCAFYSHRLSPAERNYDVGNRELLAVKMALEQWRHWLEGAKEPFVVITDHRNLEYIQAAKRLNARQARWSLFFSRFDFTITYRPGSKNGKADALSRIHTISEPFPVLKPILPPSIIVAPVLWKIDADIRREQRGEPTPATCPPDKMYVPSTVRDRVIVWSHTSLASGHPGIEKSMELISRKYWWPSIAHDVQRYVKSCSICTTTKSPRCLPPGKLMPLPTPNRPWSHLAIDFLSDLPPSKGYTVILVVVDRFSKSNRFIPFTSMPTALQVAEALFSQVFRHYGIPEDIVSDRGPQFTSQVWRAFMKKLGVTVSLTSGYHPEANGQAERAIQNLGRFLRTYCHRRQNDWAEFLPWAEYAQNSLIHSTTKLTPFQCVLGYQPPLCPWDPTKSDIPVIDDWFRRAERVWELTHLQISRAVRQQKLHSDRRRGDTPEYQPGDRVWLSTRNLKLKLPCRKLSPRFVGPFKVIRRVNPVTYTLQLPANYRVSPSFHVSLLRPLIPGPMADAVPGGTPPPALEIDGSPAYQVRALLDSRRRQGRMQYLVDWEGYGPEDQSWVPSSDILDRTLISEFHQSHPDRPAPRPRGRHPLRSLRTAGAVPQRGGTVTNLATTPLPPSRQFPHHLRQSSQSSANSLNQSTNQRPASPEY